MTIKILLTLTLLYTAIWAKEDAYRDKMIAKGEKVAKYLCDSSIYNISLSKDFNSSIQEILDSKRCNNLSLNRAKSLVIYLKYGKDIKRDSFAIHRIKVPKDAKCPVCGMFVYKYPKWSALIEINSKKYYFDGVKDMMKFYIFDGDFPFDRSKISKILVQDFYTLQPISAKDAWFVIGSNIYGPMGNELIPFKDEESAKEFMKEHKGEKILKFDEITPSIVMGLDGISF